MTKENLLTRRWNNVLTLVLGLPILIYIGAVLSAPILPDRAAFIGMVLCGVVY